MSLAHSQLQVHVRTFLVSALKSKYTYARVHSAALKENLDCDEAFEPVRPVISNELEAYELLGEIKNNLFENASEGLNRTRKYESRSKQFFKFMKQTKVPREISNDRNSQNNPTSLEVAVSENLHEKNILQERKRLFDLLENCMRIKEVLGGFNIYQKCFSLYPEFITHKHYSGLLFIFSYSIKKRIYSDDYRNQRVDRANHLEGLPFYSCKFLKTVLFDMIKRGMKLEQFDWHNVFEALSKDLDATTIEFLWWILVNRNHSAVSKKLPYTPRIDVVFPFRGTEPAFENVKLTTNMANALLRVRSYTRGEFDNSFASDAFAMAKVNMTLKQMELIGIPRDDVSYFNAITASHHHLRSDKAFLESISKVLEELMSPYNQVHVTTDHCNRIITCLKQRGLYKMAKMLYQDLCEDADRRPNITSLNMIINVLLDSPEDESIIDFYRRERERWNLKPNIFTLSILIQAQAQFGEVDGIQSILQEFREKYHLKPDKITYINIIRGFVSAGDMESAETYIKEYLDRQDLALSADPFHHLMRGYSERGQHELLMDTYSVLIYAEIRIPPKIWATLLINCIRRNQPAGSLRLFLISCKEAHVGKWTPKLLEMVIEAHVKSSAPLEPLASSLISANLDPKSYDSTSNLIISHFEKIANRPLPESTLKMLRR